MARTIELDQAAVRDLDKLDQQPRRRILAFLHDRVATLDNPRSIGEALKGSTLGEFWKYRVGDYRVIASIEDARGQAINTLTFQLDHSVGAGQLIAAIASRRWAPWRGVEEGQAQGVRRSEVPLVATPAVAPGLWATEDRASQQQVFLRAMLVRSTYARHRIRHGIRHTAARA